MVSVNLKSQPSTLDAVATRRSYKQLCGLATALDIVGERWTLLLVRDLALGPRRYSELLEGLPGIGEGLLAQRLRHLEAEGIARRAFSAEANGVVYELTDDGRELFQALGPLTRWGIRRVAPLSEDADERAQWVALAIRSRLDPRVTVGVSERYEMRVDDQPFTITADNGNVTVAPGACADAAVRISLDIETFLELGLGMLRIRDARSSGRAEVRGEREAVARYSSMLRGFR
jgi:DNA-binding HxlR family transcriptional regulator